MASKFRRKGKQPKDLASAFKRAAGIALYELVPKLDRQFTEEIQTVEWGWPGVTKRKNGETVYSPRDIVDLGDLMRSQRNQKIDNFTWRWTWDVEYSSVVHNGAVLKQGGNYPARPWTKTAIRVIDPDKIISDTLRRELDG